jgi:hypothetical protein
LNASNALIKWKGSFWIWTPQATHISIFVEGQCKEGLGMFVLLDYVHS